MPNLTQTRKRMQAALIGLLVLDALTIAFLFSPFTASGADRERLLEQAKNSLQLKQKEVEPLMGMDEKLKNADNELNNFYKNRLPDKNSTITTQMGKLADQNKIRITSAKYEHKESELPELTEVIIDASVEGDYLGIVKFINGLERDKMFFILDSIALTGEQTGGVKLALKARTYLKS